MPSFIKNNLFSIIVLSLLCTLVILQWRNKKTVDDGSKIVSIKRDTVYVEHFNQTNVLPKIIERIPYKIEDSGENDTIYYVPDTSYAVLVKQYHALVEELLAKHIISDTLKLDTLGYIHVQDTVTNNRIVGRSYISHLRFPTIYETIIKEAPPKGSFYWGAGFEMRQGLIINQLSTGFMYKTKEDVLLGTTISFNNDGKLGYGIRGYWPLRHNK